MVGIAKRKRDYQSGLTLIELLIVMAVMSLIMGGLVTAFISHTRISAAEEARIDVQQNLRVATDRLKHFLAHVGLGSYESLQEGHTIAQFENVITIDHDYDVTFISAFKLNDSNSNNDILVQSYTEDNQDESTLVDVSGSPSPSINPNDPYKSYVSFFPDINGNNFYNVLEYSNGQITIDGLYSFVEDSVVYMVSPVRIYTDDLRLFLKNKAYSSVVNPQQHWIVADNIEDIRFQFFENGGWHVDDSTIGNLNNIRKIRFWLLGRSKDSVPGAGQQDLEVVVDKDSLADNGVCIENVDSNKCVVYRVPSVDEDGRIRMLSRGEVVLRNVVLN